MAYSKDELYEQRKEVTDKLERLSEEKNKFNNRWDELDECLNRDVVFLSEFFLMKITVKEPQRRLKNC